MATKILKHNSLLLINDGTKVFYSLSHDPEEYSLEDSKVLIFNYGLVCSNYHWRYQIPYFYNLGYKIIIHDYRGHYSSTLNEISELTFRNISFDINSILTELNVNQADVICHSMGVNVGLEFYRNYPNKVRSLVLISGTVMPIDNVMFDSNLLDFMRPIFEKLYKRYPQLILPSWKYSGWNPLFRKFIKLTGFNPDQVSDEFVEVYLNKMGRLGPDIFFQLLKEMQHHSIITLLKNIKARTLIIGGDQDRVIPNHLQKLLSTKVPHSELYLMHKGSHVPQVDYPDMINERIELFYQKSRQEIQ